MTRWDLYRQRDESGLSRSEFYWQQFSDFHSQPPILEVGYGAQPLKLHSGDHSVTEERSDSPTLGVNTFIERNGKVLLTKRMDFEVWCLPGGGVDPGESAAQAAVRETREETGLEVNLTRLVGMYSRTGWLGSGLTVLVFAAEEWGGELRIQPDEVLEAGFFSPEDLPEQMLFGHRQRVVDGFRGGPGGYVWYQDAEWPFAPGTTRAELYALKKRSGLSKADFYYRYVGKPGPHGDRLEVKPE